MENNMIQEYLKLHEQEILEDLFSLLRIPSVSSDAGHHEDMLRCAACWETLLQKAGADEVQILPTAGNPVVFAWKKVNPNLPTVMVYGHYDVMPPEPF